MMATLLTEMAAAVHVPSRILIHASELMPPQQIRMYAQNVVGMVHLIPLEVTANSATMETLRITTVAAAIV